MSLLHLKPSPDASRDAVAWFVPGASVLGWVREVADWRMPMEDVVFYPIEDRPGGDLLGALAVPDRPPAALLWSGRARPYHCPAVGVFLPVDGRISPSLAADEWSGAKTADVWIWHPSAGLCGFEREEGRRVWQLLLAPPAVETRWNRARDVQPMNDRLRGVELALTLTLADVFGPESDEIGSESPASLPPLARESKFPLVAGAALVGLLAPLAWLGRAVLWAFSLLPRTALAPTWINHLENWIGDRLGRMVDKLSPQQRREIDRLLQMLQDDPVEGLRHAIALSDLSGRGTGVAGGRLGRRSLDFNLGRIGGGGRRSTWNLPADVMVTLGQRYRELAQAEQALGRHRRAACIFAELLGDLPASADALRRGRCFQEAALLYRERLLNPTAAAECLAEGGFIDEAIAIYERESKWREIALLWEKEGRPEQARSWWEREVQRLEEARNLLAAAGLIETKLADPERALRLLESTWPGGARAIDCLEERVDLLHRQSDALAVRRLVRQLANDPVPEAMAAPLITLMAKWHETWIDRRNQREAAEALRQRASVALTAGAPTRADELMILRSLQSLAPGDRLLKRDTVRFHRQRPAAPGPLRLAPALRKLERVTVEKMSTMSLPKVGEWVSVIGDSMGFQAMARKSDSGWLLTRGLWSGGMHSLSWTGVEAAPARPQLACFLREVVVSIPFGPRLSRMTLPSSPAMGTEVWDAGTPTWLPSDVVKLSATARALWAVRWVEGSVVLASYHGGRGVFSRDLTADLKATGVAGSGTTLSLDAQSVPGQVAVACGQHLFVSSGDAQVRGRELGARVMGLVERPGVGDGWIALQDRGAVFVSADLKSLTVIDDELELPKAVVTGGGQLVLIGRDAGKVFSGHSANITAEGRFLMSTTDVIAVLPTTHPREFATVRRDGHVQRWQMEA